MSSDEEDSPPGKRGVSPGALSKDDDMDGMDFDDGDDDLMKPPDNLLARVRFRPARPTDIPECYELEIASYPEDEAATKSKLQYRQHHAAKYFRCAVLWSEEHYGTTSRTTNVSSLNTAQEEPHPSSVAPMVGFVCATRCRQFRAESMSTHVPDGELLAIHSVP
jgi:hypothetical protein